MKALVTALALFFLLGAAAARGAPRVIQITAKRFEFSPAEIHLRRGEHVVLELTSLDRKHGFKLPELGIRADVPAGGTARVEVTPEKAGRFSFACDVFCGDGHDDMAGILVVEP